MARIVIKKSALLELMQERGLISKSQTTATRSANDTRFEEFKKQILEHLDSLEKDESELKKSLIAYETKYIEKGGKGLPVGTIREWKGKKYIKIAPGKWRPKYDSNTRGAKMAIAAIKRKAEQCTDSKQLLQLILENRERFSDENGRPLPFVKELSDYVSGLNDKIETKETDRQNHFASKYTAAMAKVKKLGTDYKNMSDEQLGDAWNSVGDAIDYLANTVSGEKKPRGLDSLNKMYDKIKAEKDRRKKAESAKKDEQNKKLEDYAENLKNMTTTQIENDIDLFSRYKDGKHLTSEFLEAAGKHLELAKKELEKRKAAETKKEPTEEEHYKQGLTKDEFKQRERLSNIVIKDMSEDEKETLKKLNDKVMEYQKKAVVPIYDFLDKVNEKGLSLLLDENSRTYDRAKKMAKMFDEFKEIAKDYEDDESNAFGSYAKQWQDFIDNSKKSYAEYKEKHFDKLLEASGQKLKEMPIDEVKKLLAYTKKQIKNEETIDEYIKSELIGNINKTAQSYKTSIEIRLKPYNSRIRDTDLRHLLNIEARKEFVKMIESEIAEREETEEEKHRNRSEAMKGNKNAYKGGPKDEPKGSGSGGGDDGNEPPIGHAKRLRNELKENLKSQLGIHKNKKTGIEAELSGTSIGKICSNEAIGKSKNNGFTVAEHFEMANQIVDLFENAPDVIVQNDDKNNDDNVKIERYVSNDVTLKSGKKARAYITVKHTLSTDGRLIYSIEAMDIEKALEKTRAVSGQQLENNSTSPSANTSIPQSSKKSSENETKDILSMSDSELDSTLKKYYEGDKSIDYDFGKKCVEEYLNRKNEKEYLELSRKFGDGSGWKKMTSEEKARYNELGNTGRYSDYEVERYKKYAREKTLEQREFPKKADISTIRDKYKNSQSVDGDDDTITLPDGTELEGKWKLVEADAPSASHDEMTFQKTEGFPANDDGSTINDRDYEHDSAAKEAVIDMSADFDSRALHIDSPVVVSEDGVVISGNNRTMSSKLAARKGTDAKYIDALNKKAKKFGFTSGDISKFKNPRVVFETNVNGKYSTKQFAKFNQSGKKAQSPVETAVKIAKTVNAKTIESIADRINQYDTLGELYADNKSMRDVFNTLIESDLIKKTDLPAYYTDESGVTNNGKEFLETVLVGSVINENNIRNLASAGGKEIRQKLVRAIVPLVENKGMKGYSIAKELNEAVSIAVEIKKNKKFKDADDYSKQGVLIGEQPDKIAIEFAKKLEGTQKEFAEFMRSLNGGLRPAANGEADIFLGGVESRDEILSRYMTIKKSIRELFNSFFK